MRTATLLRAGWAAVCLAAALLSGIGMTIDRLAKAALAENDPVEAARIDSRSAQALSRASAKILAEGNPRTAAEAAQRAIALSPLSQRSVTVLAMARDTMGDSLGYDAGRLGRELGWREPAAQLWLLGLQLQDGNVAAAMEHADALFRQSSPDDPLLPNLQRLAENDAVADALAARLALRPPWRRKFLTQLDALDRSSIEGHAKILSALGQTAAPPDDMEAASFVHHLINLDSQPRAQSMWLALMAARGTLVGDPNFERVSTPSTYSLFAWHAPPLPGVELHVSSGLMVGVEGPANGTILSQTLLLSPGKYSFLVDLMARDASHDESLSWTVRCAGSGKRIDAAAVRRVAGEHRVQLVTFQVPKSCGVQRLDLHVEEEGSAGTEMRLGRARVIRGVKGNPPNWGGRTPAF